MSALETAAARWGQANVIDCRGPGPHAYRQPRMNFWLDGKDRCAVCRRAPEDRIHRKRRKPK